MSAKIYSVSCLAALLCLLALTALMNRIVDPFWYYRDFNIAGINEARTEFARYERHIKPVLLMEQRPRALIFGSSYSEIGFEPLHPALTQGGQESSYNFAMAGADWARVYCNVIFALRHTDLKRAVIGIHTRPMPAVDCKSQLADMGEISQFSLLLSKIALKSSWRTLHKQKQGPSHTPQGRYFYNLHKRDRIEALFEGGNFARRIFSGEDGGCRRDAAGKIAASRDFSPTWNKPGDSGDLEGLRELLRRFAESGVEVKLVVYPVHALAEELEIVCGDGLGRWHALWRIAHLLEQSKASAELWDFQGLSDFLVEPVKNNQTLYWQDSGHFNVEMGNKMLDVIYGGEPAGPSLGGDRFGVRLTAAGVAERFADFFSHRRAYIAAHPGFHEALAGLMAPYRQP
ncbi:MAG: hypothetical protein PHE55_10025 [Methylococcaceae bacterium]|nr:hypothetical protein [Methylococcaceae bacterium]